MTELPSVALDAVVEDAAEVFVANRNPQPGEAQVPLDTTIEFDIFQPIGQLIVSVEDEEVYNGANVEPWAAGWSGAVFALPDGIGFRLRLVPDKPFSANQSVHVLAKIGTQQGFWAFETYDWMPPLIAEVFPLSETELRVTFNEPVLMGSDDPDDALEPHVYTVEYVSRPAARPQVLAVQKVSDTSVVITVSMELSFGAHYMLVVAGAQDIEGNRFLPPDNVREFYAYRPAYPVGRRWVLQDFVPRMSLAEDRSHDLKLFLAVLQDSTNLLLESVDRWLTIIDPDTAPEPFIDQMLADLGNPFRFQLQLEEKRRLVKSLILIYKLKGTAVGIRAAVRFFLGVEVVIETFVGGGWRIGHHQLSMTGQQADNPAIIGPSRRGLYSFRIHAIKLLTALERQYIHELAIYMKGAQEHLVEIRDLSYSKPTAEWWTIGGTRIGWSKISRGVAWQPQPLGIQSFLLATS